jgi:RNA polymerase sigma-70 factor (ECF subfamily)
MARRRRLIEAPEQAVTVSPAAAPALDVEASDSSARRLGGVTASRRLRPLAERAGMSELEELFRRYERPLGQFLRQLVNDPNLADDLIQETFVTATRERAKLPSIENPKAWLFQIGRNRALHAMRTRRRALSALQRLASEVGFRRQQHPEPAIDPAEVVTVRDHLAEHLKPEERALLILRYVHGFRSPELAEIVGRSPEAIRKELSRSRRKLIESFEDLQPTTSRREGTKK